MYAYRIKMYAGMLREEIDRIKGVEGEIRERMSKNTDVKNISDIHGIAMTSAAVMVAELDEVHNTTSHVGSFHVELYPNTFVCPPPMSLVSSTLFVRLFAFVDARP